MSRGRRPGARRLALLRLAHNGDFLLRDAIAATGASMNEINCIVRKMRAAGELAVVALRPASGARRPLAVYGLPRAPATRELQLILSAWPIR